MLRRLAAPTSLALAWLSVDLEAQERRDSLADSTARRLQAVTVTASRGAGVVGGASAVVIRPAELRSSPAPLLDQALREAPFILVRQNSRGEMELSVRGSDSRQAAVLLDGVPVTLGWDHRIDPSLIPITGAQSLTIVRGLGSLLHGPNTLGGVIEVRHDDGAGGAVPRGVRAGFGIDHTGATVEHLGASVRQATSGGVFSVEGGLAHRQRDGLPLADDATDPTAEGGLRTNSDLRHVDGFASFRWRSPTGWRAGLTVSGYTAERGVMPEEHIEEPRLWRYPYHRRALAALALGTGVFRTPLGIASVEAGAGFNLGKLKIESFTDRTYSEVDAIELGRERTWTARTQVTHSVGSRATFRAALTRADIRYRETFDTDPSSDYRQTLWSAAGELEVSLTERTTLAGGVGYDRSATPETGGRTPAQEPFSHPGWRVGLAHRLSDAVRLHASASRRSRFPALRELYSGALNRFAPNPELNPETLLGFEAGVTGRRGFGNTELTFQVTGFRHNLDDAVVRITLPAPDRRFMRVNRDRIGSYGVELVAGVAVGALGGRPVTLTGDAMLQRISIRDLTLEGEPERHAENNPETRARVELGVPLPLMLRASGSARYTGTQYCLHADSGEEMRLSGKMEADLALERSFSMPGAGWFSSLRTLVAVDNVGDQLVFDQCGLSRPGRTARLMITLR
jgi:iron complex outermembrane receptor protein